MSAVFRRRHPRRVAVITRKSRLVCGSKRLANQASLAGFPERSHQSSWWCGSERWCQSARPVLAPAASSSSGVLPLIGVGRGTRAGVGPAHRWRSCRRSPTFTIVPQGFSPSSAHDLIRVDLPRRWSPVLSGAFSLPLPPARFCRRQPRYRPSQARAQAVCFQDWLSARNRCVLNRKRMPICATKDQRLARA